MLNWKFVEHTPSIVGTPIKLENPYWERSDGAYVREIASPHTKYTNNKMWCAYLPDASHLGFHRRNSLFRIPRRWKTAEAAITALDKEHPLETQNESLESA